MGRWSGQPLGDLSGEQKIGELVSGARRQQLSKLPELSMAAGLLLPWAPSDSLHLFTLLQPSCRAACHAVCSLRPGSLAPVLLLTLPLRGPSFPDLTGTRQWGLGI